MSNGSYFEIPSQYGGGTIDPLGNWSPTGVTPQISTPQVLQTVTQTVPQQQATYSAEDWGDVPLSYVPSLEWLNPSYQNYGSNLTPISEGPYSGMYIAPTSWLHPNYQQGGAWSGSVMPYTPEESTTSALNFPTAEEATSWASSLAPFQMAGNMLGMASTPEGFMMSPYMQEAMQSIGRSNLPSSSYADRVMSNAVIQNALGTAGAWGDYMNAVAPWASGYAQYPLSLAQLLQG